MTAEIARAVCVMCSTPLAQPATGRRRVYCSTGCRRAAEYELRRLQALLMVAEKRLMEAEARAVGYPDGSDQVRFWAAKALELQDFLDGRLRDLAGDCFRDESE